MFPLSFRNKSEGLREREMLWEQHELQASVSTAFSSSPKLSLDRNTENMFSFSFRKYRDAKKKINLFTLIIKM